MIGFLIGTVCFIGLVGTIRRARRWRWHQMAWQHAGMGPGWGYCGSEGDGGCDRGAGGAGGGGFYRDDLGHGGFGGGFRGFRGAGRRGRRMMLRGIFERLDTTPGQEKVIQNALDELQSKVRPLRDEVGKARGDLAEALRAGAFDEALFGATFARQDGAIDTLRKAVMDAFGQIHSALDERQRGMLADFVDGKGGFRNAFGGPYRSA